jgi:hypothetical protein
MRRDCAVQRAFCVQEKRACDCETAQEIEAAAVAAKTDWGRPASPITNTNRPQQDDRHHRQLRPVRLLPIISLPHTSMRALFNVFPISHTRLEPLFSIANLEHSNQGRQINLLT